MSSYSQRYAAVLFPDRWRILGVPLLPLTLGHALLLDRLELGSAGAPREQGRSLPATTMPDIGDLLLCLWVCSRAWDRAAAHLQRRRTRCALKLWAWQMRLTSRARLDAGLTAAWAQWQAYLAAAWDAPSVWERDKSAASSAPLLQVLKVTLMSRLGHSAQSALDTPLTVALWDICCFWETKGHIEWVSPDIDAALDNIPTPLP